MRIVKNCYNEDTVFYESPEELSAAINNYLDGNYAALTCEEVALFRDCEEDPNNVRWERAHAGMFANDLDPLDFYGLVFIYDLGRNYAEGLQILYDLVGPHPITPLTILDLHNRLAHTPPQKPKLDDLERRRLRRTQNFGPTCVATTPRIRGYATTTSGRGSRPVVRLTMSRQRQTVTKPREKQIVA